MNTSLARIEILQLNTKTRLPEVCFWKAREVYHFSCASLRLVARRRT